MTPPSLPASLPARTSLAAKAGVLRELHRPGDPLLLPNIWDAGTAALVAAAGFPAVATSSVGVAESLGFPDGHGAPVAEMLAAAARITAAVDVPVTVDFEGGYGLPPAEIVDRLLTAGAVGCNLEDTDHTTGRLTEPARQADFLAVVRAAATAAGVPLVINARIDLFVRTPTDPTETLVRRAIARANAYLAAGADCVYPILAGPAAQPIIQALTPHPVNILHTPSPSGGPGGNGPGGGGSPGVAGPGGDGPGGDGGGGGSALLTDTTRGAARISLGGGLWRAHQSWLATRLAEVAAGRTPF